MDDPHDFESEDPLLISPVVIKKRNKVIGLDDLLTDYYKEKSKVIERESKRTKVSKNHYSDEEDNRKEALLSKKLNECHNQMKEMAGEEEVSVWGLRVFGEQKIPPLSVFPEIGSCPLLQSLIKNKLNSLVELTAEKVNNFLEELLMNGWLSKLVFACGHVDKSIAEWTYNLMLYSSKEELRKCSCDFWCAIFSSKNKTEKLPICFDWLPGYSELKRALETYGFLFNYSSEMEPVNENFNGKGPPKNIISWIEFVAACCNVRNKQPIFSASEVEELIEFIICLSLDRQLLGLHVLLRQCMQSAIDYFSEVEWSTSCGKLARSLACRVPKDFNCLKAVDSISGISTRSNQLRSAVSYQILFACFENKVTTEEQILDLLISINVKEKNCDLFKMYIYLTLTENWLLSNPMLEERPVIKEMWGVYLRNCSCQITSTNLRPYASKVRTKASYLLNGSMKK